MCEEVLIRTNNLSKRYEIYNNPRDRLKQFLIPRAQRMLGYEQQKFFREFWALDDISFEVRRGETLGIIGRNGSGKSTLLQILAGTLSPTKGNVEVFGRVAALLELGSGFNPEFSGRENIFLNGQILGLTLDEIHDRYDSIVEFAEIGEFIEQPVKTYSSGMFVRLAFAVQAHIDASIIIIDEALAVGDIFFRQKCYARLEQLRDSGVAILLVSHSMPDIEQYCQKAILLDHGKAVFMGPSVQAAKHYYLLHQPVYGEVSQSAKTGPILKEQLPERNFSDSVEGFLPVDGKMLDYSGISQIGRGRVKCTRASLCNERGEQCNSFRQGDKAVFFFEFELSESIGIPICGVLITNEKGVIVHGRNSWQEEADFPVRTDANILMCRQEIFLNLAIGDYTFELGLVSVSEDDWANRKNVSHDEWASRYSTECAVTRAGYFSISYAVKQNIPILTHHGVANLPGSISIAFK